MYSPQDFSYLLGTPGFSNDLLNNHFTLYNGYVKNTNSLLEKLKSLETNSQEYNETRRRFPVVK